MSGPAPRDRERIKAYIDRVIAQRFADSMRYRGTFTAPLTYKRGDVVTHRGQLWHCCGDAITAKPGTSDGWKLMAKASDWKGRDDE